MPPSAPMSNSASIVSDNNFFSVRTCVCRRAPHAPSVLFFTGKSHIGLSKRCRNIAKEVMFETSPVNNLFHVPCLEKGPFEHNQATSECCLFLPRSVWGGGGLATPCLLAGKWCLYRPGTSISSWLTLEGEQKLRNSSLVFQPLNHNNIKNGGNDFPTTMNFSVSIQSNGPSVHLQASGMNPSVV